MVDHYQVAWLYLMGWVAIHCIVGGMMRILVVNATLVIEVVLVIRSDSLLKSHFRRILPQYRQQSPINIAIAIVITKGNVGML